MNPRIALLGLAGAAVSVVLAGSPVLAADLCKAYPQDQWMKAGEITAKAEALGYQIRKLDIEDGCYEVKGTKDGKRVEAYFDPVTGEVVKVKG